MDELKELDLNEQHTAMCERFRKDGIAAFAKIIAGRDFSALPSELQGSAVVIGPLAAAMCSVFACVGKEGRVEAVRAMVEAIPDVYKVISSVEEQKH